MKRSMWAVWLTAILCISGPVRAEEIKQASSENKKAVNLSAVLETAPIIVWNRTITDLRADYEDSTAEDRARRATARIEALPSRADFKILIIEASKGDLKGFILGTETETLFALLPGDVDTESGETLETKAKAAADQLRAVLDEHAEQMKWPNLLQSLGLSGAATLLYLLVIWGVLRIRHLAMARIERLISAWKQPLLVAGIDLVPVLLGIERFIIRISLITVFIAATYIWLTFCFAQFFFTEPWARQLGKYLVELTRTLALSMVSAVPGIFTVIVIFWLTRVAAAGVSGFFLNVEKGRISVSWLQPDSARASRRIVVAVIWIFALTVAYPYIPGSGSEAFKGISVFAGLMISIGSSGFINHIMSGLVIAYSGAMRVGDYVSVNNIEGTVNELGTMSTKIVTPKNEFVAIPNGVAISAHVVNYSRMAGKDGAVISTNVTIGYDAPWRQVHALLLKAAEKTNRVRKSPLPFVLQRALSDFYVSYELRVYIDQPASKGKILSELHAEIQDAFNEAGVQIMSPNFESQPDNPVLVPKARWYATPVVSPEKNEKGDIE